MNRTHMFRLAVSIGLALAAAPAQGQTWTGAAGDGFWSTAANWSPNTVPNSPSANVNFSDLNGVVVKLFSNFQAQSLTFSNLTGEYVVAGGSLSGLTAINVAAGVTQTNYINLDPTISTGNLLFAAGNNNYGNLAISNNSVAASEALVIDRGTVIGTAGHGGVICAGPGTTALLGSFAAPGDTAVVGGLTKTGPGTLSFIGDGSNLYGGLTLNGGTLQLDYSVSAALKLSVNAGPGGVLTLGGGSLYLIPNQGTQVTQTIPGGTVVNAGHTDVYAQFGSSITLAAGGMTRNVGGTVDFSPFNLGGSTFTITTSAGTTNGLLGTGPAFATVLFGQTWATVSGGTVVGLTINPVDVDHYGPGINTDVVNSGTPVAPTNSLRFNTGAPTLSGDLTVQSGGILVTQYATGGTITGGNLNATGNGELFVHQYCSGTFTISSSIVTAVGLTKTGPGTLALGGANVSLTGPINVNRGNLTVTSSLAVVAASAINFNDIRTSTTLGGAQTFTIDLGNNVNGTINAPILVSAYSPNDFGTYFSIESSQSSLVTLSGVISSAAGQTTPIRFYANSFATSGFNLTNANTFTGNVSLYNGGTLGISSDASLGNPANVLALESGNTAAGGLVFLHGLITVARPVAVNDPTRIVSNDGNFNTISGPISGAAGLFKAGGGTLEITNPNNTITGGVTVAEGTLSLGATGGLPAGTNVTVGAGATFTPGTSPNGNTLGTLTLNGGTFRGGPGQVPPLLVNQIVTGPTGGSLDLSASSVFGVELLGAAPAITINGNSTWVSPNNYTFIYNVSNSDDPLTIAAGVTLTNGLGLSDNYGYGFHIAGGGTLYQNASAGAAFYMNAPLTVSQSVFRVTDVTSNGGVGNVGTGTFTLDGGTFSYGGPTATMNKVVFLTANGGTVQVESPATALTINDPVVGRGGLTKTGPGTLLLLSQSDSFTSLTVNAGTVQAYQDAALGPGPVTVNPLGMLTYLGTTTTARTISMFGSTLSVVGGATLTLNGATIGTGFLRGPGTFALTGGTTLSGVTTSASTVINQTGAGSFVNFSNGGAFTIAAGLAAASSFTTFTNQGSGAIVVGAASAINVTDFQTYGSLTINPAVVGSGQQTMLTNVGTTPLNFNGGSRTFIGTPATAIDPNTHQPTFVAGIDLNGKNSIVAGGLFVNNGFVADGSPAGTATIIADFGALVKGAGFFQNSVITQNGGKFQAGNSPGSASFGGFVLGPGGVSNYVFAIDDATGTAGPSPDANGHVSGWGLVKAVKLTTGPVTTPGDFTWTATPVNTLSFTIDTLVNPTTVGTDITGPMADFDPTRTYTWPAVQWTGIYAGPADAAALDAATTFDTSGVANPIHGTFGWDLDSADQTLSLTYAPTAVPEPGTLALSGIAAIGWVTFWRRRWQRNSPSTIFSA